MRVLAKILSSEWLWDQIRVIGGAYGAYCAFTPAGFSYFGSYRDPNLRRTLEIYEKTSDYLHDFRASERVMRRFIIGTIAGIDRPLTPSQEGSRAFIRHMTGVTLEDVRRSRHEILTTSAEDIRAFAPMIREMINRNLYCVFGGEERLEKESHLFSNLLRLK